jgi:hypothetical protein
VVDAPWLADDRGFRAGCFGVSAGETSLRDRGFGSVTLQRRVCEPSVPLRRTATPAEYHARRAGARTASRNTIAAARGCG